MKATARPLSVVRKESPWSLALMMRMFILSLSFSLFSSTSEVVPEVTTTGLPAVLKVFDVGAFLHKQAGADHEDGVGESGLLLALEVIGGGAAFEVIGAVLQQRDAVLRGNRQHFHLQIRRIKLFLTASTIWLE